MRLISGRRLELVSVHIDGPWPCEKCGQLSQFAECKSHINRIFCKNERCRFTRIVDKRRCTIVENDGSMWQYDPYSGAKKRIK